MFRYIQYTTLIRKKPLKHMSIDNKASPLQYTAVCLQFLVRKRASGVVMLGNYSCSATTTKTCLIYVYRLLNLLHVEARLGTSCTLVTQGAENADKLKYSLPPDLAVKEQVYIILYQCHASRCKGGRDE